MTPTRLRQRLLDRNDTRELAPLDAPELAVALEVMAEATPGDRELEHLTVHAQAWADLGDAPLAGSGLRLGALVRWDGWSVTCEAVDTQTGQDVLARVLRPRARTPAHRRRLAREGRVLATLPSLGVELRPGVDPALTTPLTGGPLLAGPPPPPDLGLRSAVRIVADLSERTRLGLGLVDPDDAELRLASDGARLLCLQVDPDPTDLGDLVRRLEFILPDGPIESVLDGAIELPPRTADELAGALFAALAVDLASRRHGVVHRWRERRGAHDRARLRSLTERLSAFAPPVGRGAVGVDMEGRTTVVHGDGRTLSWGPVEGPALAIVSEQGLHPRTARRLLRARSAAPPSARLNGLVDGDEAFTEQACRWVSAALALRTVRMLLDVPT